MPLTCPTEQSLVDHFLGPRHYLMQSYKMSLQIEANTQRIREYANVAFVKMHTKEESIKLLFLVKELGSEKYVHAHDDILELDHSIEEDADEQIVRKIEENVRRINEEFSLNLNIVVLDELITAKNSDLSFLDIPLRVFENLQKMSLLELEDKNLSVLKKNERSEYRLQFAKKLEKAQKILSQPGRTFHEGVKVLLVFYALQTALNFRQDATVVIMLDDFLKPDYFMSWQHIQARHFCKN